MDKHQPLADRLRPQDFSEFRGQPHLTGPQGLITRLVKSGKIPSMIFWGPPGSGKTSLAHIIAKNLAADFIALSAVTTKFNDVRRIVETAANNQKYYGKRTILFIDEIHRFNKIQQDAFLPHIETGTIILIGATTENPSFEVIGPLLSRAQILVFHRLTDKELQQIAQRALKYLKREIAKDALKFLLEASNGDSRVLINTLEIAASITTNKKFILANIEIAFQKKQLRYDRTGDEHYDTISAFIKSMRASQPDAALYYLARMIEAGEDPLFIARRMVIFASEDIGIAQPTALVVANAVFRACETIGYPECAINLAHGVVYLCLAKKDRRAYNGLIAAQADVKRFGNLPIPKIVRNPVTKLMKDLQYGAGYQPYTNASFLPEPIKHKKYF